MKLFIFTILVTVFSSVVTQLTDIEGYQENLIHPERFIFRNACYTSLDDECFYNGPPFFHPIYRQFSDIPDEAKDVIFRLFTPNNSIKRFKLKPTEDSLQLSPFDCNLNTVVISHGFIPNFDTFLEMKDALLNLGKFNVILNDWQKYAQMPYFQAVANTRTVGARVAKLIKSIWDVCKTDGSRFYLVGHSLGAQVSGYAGKRLPGLRRITGLDPAAPYFQGLDKEVHLDADDAEYVDTIHTSAANYITKFGFGYLDRLGDLDFYANDGTTQPNCKLIDPVHFKKYINYTELSSLVSCSHSRANELFTESIRSANCKFVAVLCDSFEDFENGKCPADERPNAVVGFPSEKIPGAPPYTTFVFRTNGSSPFCIPDGNKPEPKKKWLESPI